MIDHRRQNAAFSPLRRSRSPVELARVLQPRGAEFFIMSERTDGQLSLSNPPHE